MKKALIVKIVILSIILIGLISLFVNLMIGSGKLGSISFGLFGFGFNSTGHFDNDAYTVINGSATINEQIDYIEINYMAGNVDVVPYDGEKIVIEEKVEANISNDDRARYNIDDNKLTIQYRKSGFEFGFFSTPKKSITVKYPRNYEYKKVKVSVVSSDLNIEDMTSSEFKIENVSGDVKIKSGRCNEIRISSVSGDINIKDIFTTNIRTESVSGNTNVSGLFKELKASSVSGSVEIDASELNGFRADFDTVSGKVRGGGDITFDKKGDTYVYGNGESEIDVETVSGELMLCIWN